MIVEGVSYAMMDCRLRSLGVIGDKKVTFIDTLFATFMTNVDLVDVYSKLV